MTMTHIHISYIYIYAPSDTIESHPTHEDEPKEALKKDFQKSPWARTADPRLLLHCHVDFNLVEPILCLQVLAARLPRSKHGKKNMVTPFFLCPKYP